MAEADPSENQYDDLISGLKTGDLTSGVYEGGFKTWECALDLASVLTTASELDSKHRENVSRTNGLLHVIELGAGSSIPSLTLLQRVVAQSYLGSRVHFTLCDYNYEVLRLVTAPNIFLAGRHNSHDSQLVTEQAQSSRCGNTAESEDIEDITPEMVSTVISDLSEKSISFSFVSGSWEKSMVDLLIVPERSNLLIVASETIYSPASTSIFTGVLMDVLRRHRSRWPGTTARALVAAKLVYFGVGGSVDEFVRLVQQEGGLVYERVDFGGKGSGLGRVVLDVRLG